ncbi:MAG: PhzF family phenazine biosynthesis protein, partial [Candidatus Eremiobacteraeota bacterium]|nr:PhzF family phenazine biosynthesis protein [Candidatus Eremiobacteraeota bacterium]
MASYRYLVVDVFTQTQLAGNPLAVFPDARGLDAATMQK